MYVELSSKDNKYYTTYGEFYLIFLQKGVLENLSHISLSIAPIIKMLRTLCTLYNIVLVSCHLAVAGYIKKHRYNNKFTYLFTIPIVVQCTSIFIQELPIQISHPASS